jgi:hypothetical protein
VWIEFQTRELESGWTNEVIFYKAMAIYIYIYIFSLSFFLEQIKNKRTKLKIIIIEGISMIMITNNQPRKSHNGNFHWNQ